jgi:hypothetical protein
MNEFSKKAKKTLRKVLIYSIIGLLIVGLGYLWVCSWTYSDGTRAGFVVKATKKGFVWKTYEGQLNMGGVQTNESGLVGNIWDFSIRDKDLFQEILNNEGQKVRLHYRQVIRAMPWQGKTNYFVYKIEKIGNSPDNSGGD